MVRPQLNTWYCNSVPSQPHELSYTRYTKRTKTSVGTWYDKVIVHTRHGDPVYKPDMAKMAGFDIGSWLDAHITYDKETLNKLDKFVLIHEV